MSVEMTTETTTTVETTGTTTTVKNSRQRKAERKAERAAAAEAAAAEAAAAEAEAKMAAEAAEEAEIETQAEEKSVKKMRTTVRVRAFNWILSNGNRGGEMQIREGIGLSHCLRGTLEVEVKRGHLSKDGFAYTVTDSGKKALSDGTLNRFTADARWSQLAFSK